ncbi:MAG: hypothetical protein NTY34_00875 [Candidatus Omnitrophica bacterium]|nr:hypothetical protein [Candidatus Omnitrophota bacterium]
MKKMMLVLLALVLSVPILYAFDFTSYTDKAYKKKSVDAPIEIFFGNEKPSRAYKFIGEITGNIKSAEDLKGILQKEARNAGGDAVINIQTGTPDVIVDGRRGNSHRPNSQDWIGVDAEVVVYTDNESMP